MKNTVRDLCEAPAGQVEILQGNMAFATGCVRGGLHAADGYPGTPSTEVIDRGLSKVQDLIHVGWSVNEAVAAAVGMGHSLAGSDCVVTMKIPGLFQAGDIFTSGALFHQPRGALVYYIASDFTPSSTQHTIDPHYLFKSCFVPVYEPRTHQEMHEAPALAVEISRAYNTQVVVMPGGSLCHSEGLVRLMPRRQCEPRQMPASLKSFQVLPALARKNYDTVMATRMPALEELVETSPLNHWHRGSGRLGIITCGAADMSVREVCQSLGVDADVLSLAFTNPLPLKLIRKFCDSISGDIHVIEDGYRFIQETVEMLGFHPLGKPAYSPVTEWSPSLVAQHLGLSNSAAPINSDAVARPPVICPGCPYRLFAEEVSLLKKKKMVDAVFGDIGCNTLLYFMNALDTGLAMGASEAMRLGYAFSRPEQAGRCLSVLGDGTECHSGMDATRNSVYRGMPGVKVILDNSWAGMTGGQPSPTSPHNLAGQKINFNLSDALKAHGAEVINVGAYEKKNLRIALKTALADAGKGKFTTILVSEGMCVQMAPASSQRVMVEPDACKKCNACLICPGLELNANGIPVVTNLCTGCGGSSPACVQMCPTNVLKPFEPEAPEISMSLAEAPILDANLPHFDPLHLPSRISLAIRGVGGQGNLFFGSVLSRLALLAGYGESNIIKGETHGMAQMGGPVISTFGCGKISSPMLVNGSADCLIAMEKSEVLRPGFLKMLRPDGTILLAATKIIPPGLPAENYPQDGEIQASLAGLSVINVDPLAIAQSLGDPTGRTANVVMLGLLSSLPTFSMFPVQLWLAALHQANSSPAVWAANSRAFIEGRNIGEKLAQAAI